MFQLRLRGQVTLWARQGLEAGLSPSLYPCPLLLQPVAAVALWTATPVHRAATLLLSQPPLSWPFPFLSVVRNSFGAWTLCLRERESPCLSQGHLLEETLLPQSKRERPRPLCSGKNLLVLSPLPSGSSTGEVPMPPPWCAPHCADPRGNLARQVSPHFADGETEAWVL